MDKKNKNSERKTKTRPFTERGCMNCMTGKHLKNLVTNDQQRPDNH